MALDGGGVALVNGPFVDAELKSRRLVRPVGHEVQCPGGWGLICRQDARDSVRVKAFADWIVAEVGRPAAT